MIQGGGERSQHKTLNRFLTTSLLTVWVWCVYNLIFLTYKQEEGGVHKLSSSAIILESRKKLASDKVGSAWWWLPEHT